MPTARLDFARARIQRIMSEDGKTCVITDPVTDTVVYRGICRTEATPANEGQIAEPDPVEAGSSEYTAWKIFLPYPEGANKVIPGHVFYSVDDITGADLELTITATEENRSMQTEVQLEGVIQRSSSEQLWITLIRVDWETGEEDPLAPQLVRLALDGPVPIGASPEATGGTTEHIYGTMIFEDKDSANVMAGDRFKYLGRFGEVTGVPTVAPDRLEARIRIAGGT
jgi:hypothetical protein